MKRDLLIIEVARAARAAARSFGASYHDAQDAAQDAALAALRTLATGSPIGKPGSYGARIGALAARPDRAKQKQRPVARGLCLDVSEDRRVSA